MGLCPLRHDIAVAVLKQSSCDYAQVAAIRLTPQCPLIVLEALLAAGGAGCELSCLHVLHAPLNNPSPMVLAVTPVQLPRSLTKLDLGAILCSVLGALPGIRRRLFMPPQEKFMEPYENKLSKREQGMMGSKFIFTINKTQALTPQSHSWNHSQQEAGPRDSQGLPRTLQTGV